MSNTDNIDRNHKLKKIIIIIASVLLLLIISILTFAPDYITSYINNNGKELTNRKIHIENIDLNIFSGKASVDNFTMYEDDDSTVFMKFDTIFINLEINQLWSDKVFVQEFELVNPKINLTLENDKFNFDSLIKSDTTSVDNADKDTTNQSSYTYTLNNIKIKSGEINYLNNDAKIHHSIEDFDLNIKHIAFDNTTAKIALSFKLDQGGEINTKVDFNTSDNTYILNLDVNKLNLEEFLPYLQKDINVKDMQGTLFSSLVIEGTAESPGKPVVKGSIGVENLALTDSANLEFFKLKKLKIASDELSIKDMNFIVDTLLIDDVYAQFELYKNTNSVERLFYKDTKEKVEKKVDEVVEIADSLQGNKPVHWEVKHLIFRNSKARFIDYSVTPDKFDYTLSDIQLLSNNIRFGNNVKFSFSSTTPLDGKIFSEITTDPGNPGNGEFNLFMENVDSKKLSPYFLNYFAYPITKGKFNFSFRSNLNNRYLDSRVIIDSYSLSLGEKRENVEPKSGLPIKTALVIASDNDKRINFDVKVKGNIDDPNFRVGKVVFNTIMKNLGKIVATPGKILSKGVGVNESKIKKITFDQLQRELGPSQSSKLNVIIELLKEKNPLKAKIQLYVNKEDETERIIYRRAKAMYYLKKKYNDETNFSRLNPNDRLSIREMDIDDSDFGDYLSEKTGISYMSNEDKCKQLFSDSEVNSLFNKLNQERISNIRESLSKEEGILFTVENKVVYSKYVSKPYMKFEYFIEGEETNAK